jgi:hypothetical protein
MIAADDKEQPERIGRERWSGWLAVVRSAVEFVERHPFAVAYLLVVGSLLALLPALEDYYVHGDVRLYQEVTEDLLAGKLPYRDRVLEYPPYAIPIFALPRVFGPEAYPAAFICLALAVDTAIKGLLLLLALRHSKGWRALAPLACYCAGVPFLRFFILQRYDLWPAVLCLAGIWLVCSGRFLAAGACLALGIGVKLYPVVLVPPLFVLALRQARAGRFVAGLALGLAPMAALGFPLPWWRFAQFHGARGLQCESVYASLLWLGRQLGWVDAQWVHARAWTEVQGALAAALLPWARVLWAAATALSAGLASWSAVRAREVSVAAIARLLLLPLLAFVAFNQVLSPQYMVWLLSVAALTALEGELWTAALVLAATALTPVFFPSLFRDYGRGLSLLETAVLVGRNLVLILTWALLASSMCRELLEHGQSRKTDGR